MSALSAANHPWNLEAFLDSLIVELDKARDTLAVKALTRPLTYSVQDIELELQCFPVFDGDEVRFVTAQPGQEGASKLGVQLGSITARSIKETTSDPITRDDVSIELLDDIDDESKASLRKLGIKSGRDLERVEERDVDLENVTKKKLDYGNLASIINKARRRQVAPTISRVGLARSQGETLLAVEGSNLVLAQSEGPFPIALLDGEPVEVVRATDRGVYLKVDPERLAGKASELQIALDRFATMTLELKA
jgi:hypothetical protein